MANWHSRCIYVLFLLSAGWVEAAGDGSLDSLYEANQWFQSILRSTPQAQGGAGFFRGRDDGAWLPANMRVHIDAKLTLLETAQSRIVE